ncbi:MAG: CDP-glucose 4,6-dehydratase [Verrucomicrobia bacterium]|nr:CDP-glucose 4,6-dehydratase [Verrucomicrobiota bacterium]
MTPEFWKNKSVFLTGHTGFKGAWLSLWLQSLGAKVTGYALQPPTNPSLFEMAGVARGMESVIADVRDLDSLQIAMRAAQPEIVIHMAAQALVRESYTDPVGTYATNVMGSVNVLESVRHTPGIKSVVVVSSDKCYENREWLWPYNEEHAMGGHDPYSNSKGCTELVVSAYRSSFFHPDNFAKHGVALGSARAGNVIGGGDWAKDRLVPDVLKALIEKRAPVLRNPRATRPWQHVLEPLNGYLTLAEALHRDSAKHASGWNFGPFEFSDQTVGWVTDHLCKLWGAGARWEQDPRPAPHEAHFLRVDSSKARAKLGWVPKLDPLTALEWTVSWTKAWTAGDDMRRFTAQQIQSFATRTPFDPIALRPN